MAQLSIRQEMKMISLLIMRMRMNERNIFMLLLLTIVLIVKRRSGRFRRFRKKQKKSNDVLGDLVGEIHRYITVVMEANEEMKGISTYFKKQTDSSDRKMRIYDELMELSDLSQQEIMDVGEYILKNDHKIDNFFALPKAFRRDYVMKQLSQIKHK